MKFLVLSDLHLEFASFDAPSGVDYDAVILAGDIHSPGHRAVHWARRDSVFGTQRPIVIVPGNHEFYGACLPVELEEMRKAAEGTNVHVLDRDELVLDGPDGGKVRILGATLWTDFMLEVKGDDGYRADPERALATANRYVNDFRLITVLVGQAPQPKTERRKLTAEDTLARHWIDRAWLLRQLASPFDGATIVVTHHAPGFESVAPEYVSDWLSPAFVSNLPDEFFGRNALLRMTKPALWVHGHTHSSASYLRYKTRVLANPRGYRLKDGSFENSAFDPTLVVDVLPLPKQKQLSLLDLAGSLKPGPGVKLPVPIDKLGFPRGEES
jgi:predicted phosphodiesterase